tara:strand:+ start:1127 stop:1615 length:489 start_codon:yes stop_codon:yes gene_type:complete
MTATKTKSGHPMRKTTFQINEDKTFDGYSGDTYWNGWEEPCFDEKTSQEVLDYYLNQECKESAEGWKESFEEVLDSENKLIFSKMRPIYLENGEIVYDLSFGYCWTEVEDEEDKVQFTWTRTASRSLYQALDVFVMKKLDGEWCADEENLHEIFNQLKKEVM